MNRKLTKSIHPIRWVALLAAAVPSFSQAADKVWNVITTGSYDVGGNWTAAGVPTSSDRVFILNGGEATITTAGTRTVSELYLGRNVATSTSGTGTLSISAGTFQVNAGEVSIGYLSGSTGTLNISDTGILSTSRAIRVARDAGSTGTLDISDSGQLTTSAGIAFGIGTSANASVTVSGSGKLSSTQSGNGDYNFTVGINGGTATLDIEDSAVVSSSAQIFVANGSGSNGTLTMTGGTLSANSYVVAGRNGGTGTVSISGSSDVNFAGFLMAGAGTNGNSTGTITIGGDATVDAQTLRIGFDHNTNSGTITINSDAVVTTTGTGVNSGVRFSGAMSGTRNRELNLDGGTLATDGFFKSGGTATIDVNFNGGTVKATVANADFFSGLVAADMDIEAGGLAFDTNGFAVTITQNLSGVGDLTKEGAGTLTLNGTSYLGDTIVEVGTLSFGSISLEDTSDLYLSSDSFVNLSFVGTDSVNRLFIDGVMQVHGTWGGSGSGADNISPLITGTGMLLVAVPEPSEVALGVVGMLLIVAMWRRRHA